MAGQGGICSAALLLPQTQRSRSTEFLRGSMTALSSEEGADPISHGVGKIYVESALPAPPVGTHSN